MDMPSLYQSIHPAGRLHRSPQLDQQQDWEHHSSQEFPTDASTKEYPMLRLLPRQHFSVRSRLDNTASFHADPKLGNERRRAFVHHVGGESELVRDGGSMDRVGPIPPPSREGGA